MDAVPSLMPQVAGVVDTAPVMAAGCVIVTSEVLEQPPPSVTVTVYVPAVNPVEVAPVAPLLQEYV